MSTRRTRIPLEADIEKAFLKKLKAWDPRFKTRKLNGRGFNSWPDRLVLGPQKLTCLIEFKRPELGRISPGQEELFAELASLGHLVSVFDDADEALEYVQLSYTEHCGG